MRLLPTLAISLISLLLARGPKEQTPLLLSRAAHCLAIKNFLPNSTETKLTLGYLLDEESYPGKHVLYLVSYESPSCSGGLVFAIFLTEHEGRQNFNIQNNARFRLTKGEPFGVDFVKPPLGGTWTQQHMASAIMKIEGQQRFTLTVNAISAPDSSISCESYTDPQRKGDH